MPASSPVLSLGGGTVSYADYLADAYNVFQRLELVTELLQGRKFMSCSHCQELCQQASWLLIGCMHKIDQPIRSQVS